MFVQVTFSPPTTFFCYAICCCIVLLQDADFPISALRLRCSKTTLVTSLVVKFAVAIFMRIAVSQTRYRLNATVE